MEKNCSYFQATVPRQKAWFLVGILRSYEHLAFERTFDKQKSIFEFFVPSDLENHFLELMQIMQELKIIHDLTKQQNRLS